MEETPESKAVELLRWIMANPEMVPASTRREAAELVERFTGNEGWLDFVKRQESVVLNPGRHTGAEVRAGFLEIIRFIDRFAGG